VSHEAFLQAIGENREDPTPALKYANWLEGLEDTTDETNFLVEFIHNQARLAIEPSSHPERWRIQALEQAWLKHQAPASINDHVGNFPHTPWRIGTSERMPSLHRGHKNVIQFKGGFPHTARLSVNNMQYVAGDWAPLIQTWIPALSHPQKTNELKQFVGSKAFESVRTFDMRHVYLNMPTGHDKDWYAERWAWTQNSILERVQTLVVSVAGELVTALERAPGLQQVQTLKITPSCFPGIYLDPQQMKSIAARMPNLKVLDLQEIDIVRLPGGTSIRSDLQILFAKPRTDSVGPEFDTALRMP